MEASADMESARRNHFAHSDQAAEIERLRLELEMSQGQLNKSQSHLRFLEEQMNLFDKESIEYDHLLLPTKTLALGELAKSSNSNWTWPMPTRKLPREGD